MNHPFSYNSTHRDYGDDPWRLVVRGLDPGLIGRDESVFALGNGYLGLRGNFEEGRPYNTHGTFVNGLHETWRIQHAENAYGFAEHGQTIVNAPDGKTIRIYVDDEMLNLETSDILAMERVLDMREGTLSRTVIWITPTGKRVLVESRRMVSFVSRHVATIELSVTVLDADADLSVSSLIINRQNDGTVTNRRAEDTEVVDPRKSEEMGERVLIDGPARHDGTTSVLSYRVRNSQMALGVGVSHDFACGEGWVHSIESGEDRVRHHFRCVAREGQRVTLTKTLAYHSSATAGLDEMLDRCLRSLDRTADEPLETRWEQQREFLEDFWDRSDVQIGGAPADVQQAVRWNMLQLAQGAARADGRGIGAKGVTGSGYSGHYFWDTEIYVMPFLTYTSPVWARNALRAREWMLPKARARAEVLNEQGALFPWRTINGEEASAYYAAGTAAYHINADITFALARYLRATGDTEFLAQGAADIAVETARLWASLGFWQERAGHAPVFHIHGVTGPDEYTTVVNDNLFTNVMARLNLRFAADQVRELERTEPEAYERLAARLSLQPGEVEAWESAAQWMAVPYSEEMGVHPQDAHFLEREVWDLAATPPDHKPLLLHFHPLVIYRFQVLKQADVVLALLLASNEFTRAEKRRDFEYYDALTTGDSTLSAVAQAVIAAEIGYRDLAYRYFEHALRVDLEDLHRNTSDGVHVASTGGVWMSLVQGFAGMRDAGGVLSFDPRLPVAWDSISFKLLFRGQRIAVELLQDRISFQIVESLTPAETVRLTVRDVEVEVRAGEPAVVTLDGQGPDLGVFRGLSAGILPHDGEQSHPMTMEIPTLPPSQ